MKHGTPTVAVVIPSWNDAEALGVTLSQLEALIHESSTNLR